MKIGRSITICVGLSVAAIVGYYLKQKNSISENRALVVVELKDPFSAQFRNERTRESGWLCGEINSKNSYGAYTGFKRFSASTTSGAFLEDTGLLGTKKSSYYEEKWFAYRMKKIGREIEILELTNKNGFAPSLVQLKDEDFQREFFEEQWKLVCS